MTSRDYRLHDGQKGAALAVRVISRARKNEIVEILNDGTIKIRLKASPGKEDVNPALIAYLAQVLETEKENIDVVAGEGGSDKLVSVLNIDAETLHQRVVKSLA